MKKMIKFLNFYILFLLFSCQNVEELTNIKQINNPLVVCADGDTVDGIDVSYYQGNIDWQAVKDSGIEFAFIRVSDGLSFIDPKFEQNWIGAKEAGIIRGVYQFFRPARDPIAQADLLLEKMGELEEGDLPPVIDVEAVDGQTPEQISNAVRLWIERIESSIGRKPIIYSGKYFWNDNVKTIEFSEYPFWIAQYGPVCPDLPLAWDEWLFFQTSSEGIIPGIVGDVDTNLFNGNIQELLEFANFQSFCGDSICSSGENVDSCSHDCKPCQVILNNQENIIDERSECFITGGPEQFLREINDAGYNNTLIWTHTTDLDIEYNFGEWNLYFAEDGVYKIEVYIEPLYAESIQAKYEITEGSGFVNYVVIDQTLINFDGWHNLGEFEFKQGNFGQKIKLSDNTGESGLNNTQLVFDAIKVTKINDLNFNDNNEVEDIIQITSCAVSNIAKPGKDFIGFMIIFTILIILLFYKRNKK